MPDMVSIISNSTLFPQALSVCQPYGPILSAIAAIGALGIYLARKGSAHPISPPPPVIDRASWFALPTLRKASQEEALHLGSGWASPLRAPTNVCSVEAAAHTWLIGHEWAIRRAAASEKNPSHPLHKLVSFLHSYREAASRDSLVDLSAVLQVLYETSPEYKRGLDAAKETFLKNIEKQYQFCCQDLSETPKDQNLLLYRTLLEGYRKNLQATRARSPVDLQRELQRCDRDMQICAAQQDPEEIIGTLEGLVAREIQVAQCSFAQLKLDPKERLAEGQDPMNYPIGAPTPLTRVPVALHHIAGVLPPFSQLFQGAFLSQRCEPIWCHTNHSARRLVPVEAKWEQLSQAPAQFVLQLNRFSHDGISARAIRDEISGIDEIMEVPGTLFLDGEGAVYGLTGMIVQRGSDNPSGGHCYAVVRTTGGWTKVDGTQISPCENPLEEAGKAYMLTYKQLPSRTLGT